jgi:hypothetical protein
MKNNNEKIPIKNDYYYYIIYKDWINLKNQIYIKDFKNYYNFTKNYLNDITRKFMKKNVSNDYIYYYSLIFDSFIHYLKRSIFSDEDVIINIDINNNYDDLHNDSMINKKKNMYIEHKLQKQRLYKWHSDELWYDYCICNNPLDRKISYEDIKNVIYEQYYDY